MAILTEPSCSFHESFYPNYHLHFLYTTIPCRPESSTPPKTNVQIGSLCILSPTIGCKSHILRVCEHPLSSEYLHRSTISLSKAPTQNITFYEHIFTPRSSTIISGPRLVKSADLLTPSEPDVGSSAPDRNI